MPLSPTIDTLLAPLCAVIVIFLIRFTKEDVPPFGLVIPRRWRPALAFALGLAASVIRLWLTGKPFVASLNEVVAGALAVGGGAIGGYELLIKSLRGGRDLFERVPDLPPGPTAADPEPDPEPVTRPSTPSSLRPPKEEP